MSDIDLYQKAANDLARVAQAFSGLLELSEKLKGIGSVQQAADEADQRLANVNEDLAGAVADVAAAKNEAAAVRAGIPAAQAELAKVNADIATARGQLDAVNAELARVKAKFA